MNLITSHLVAAAASMAIGAAGAAWVQSQRYGLQIEQLQHQATAKELAGANQAVKEMAGFQKGLSDALAELQRSQQRNAEAQLGLDRSLRDLRGFTAGLRGDFADLPSRIERASQPALAEYATACTAVFEAMAAGGGRLSEAGAGIARQAEGHAADVQALRAAWPVIQRQPTTGGQP